MNAIDAMDRRAFLRWLAWIALVGLILRLVAVAFASRQLAFGDGVWYNAEAQIISGGHGYLAPGQYIFGGRHLATAEHPPLFPFLLAVVAWFGGESVLANQITLALIGAAAIVVIGFLGRAVAGPRVGVIAAALAALSPTIWQYDVRVLSEGLLVLTFGLFLLVVYQFWNQPRPVHVFLLGLTLAAATYTRAEMIFLGVVVLVPVVIWNPRLAGRSSRLRIIATSAAVTLLLLAPWVIRNVTTFDETVLISNNQDSVIAGANCDVAYYGHGIGSWSAACNTGGLTHLHEQSRVFSETRRRGIAYARDHLDRLPVVAAVRVGRTWEVFRPFEDLGAEGRNHKIWVASTLTFWVLAGLGLFGALQLRKSRQLVWPLAVMAPFVTVLAIGTYGLVRLRMPLDIALLVLAAVPIERFLARSRRAPTDTAAAMSTDTSAGIRNRVLP